MGVVVAPVADHIFSLDKRRARARLGFRVWHAYPGVVLLFAPASSRFTPLLSTCAESGGIVCCRRLPPADNTPGALVVGERCRANGHPAVGKRVRKWHSCACTPTRCHPCGSTQWDSISPLTLRCPPPQPLFPLACGLLSKSGVCAEVRHVARHVRVSSMGCGLWATQAPCKTLQL
jgi:hypothetical protein